MRLRSTWKGSETRLKRNLYTFYPRKLDSFYTEITLILKSRNTLFLRMLKTQVVIFVENVCEIRVSYAYNFKT